ncbi:tetratricopeptide repeat protein [Streptomyces sp. NPDC048392]|uniref:tetratricopeptide repeat protein n=1 Tax=Streptomyces sp. NPDC048392 TaxID=3365543 RepID=UPI003718B61F
MARLGRDKQREHERGERPPDPAATPIEVRVPEADSAARGASVDGALVVAAPGEEIQNAVLNRLHRLALAAGHPVLATVHDRRIGYSVTVRVDPDGSSHLAAEPAPEAPEEAEEAPVRQDRPTRVLGSVEPGRAGAPTFPLPAVSEAQRTRSDGESAPTFTLRALPEPAGGTAAGGTPPGTVAPPTGEFGPPPRMDGPTATGASKGAEPRPTPGPPAARQPVTASERATTSERAPAPEPVAAPRPVAAPESDVAAQSVHVPRPVHAPEPLHAPGPVAAPESDVAAQSVHVPRPVHAQRPVHAPEPLHAPGPPPAPEPRADPVSGPGLRPEPKPTPTPARGFDAVAEAVLGDEPLTAPGDATAPALLAEPTARINEAVKEGRTDAAARLAEQAVAEASRTLGPEHPEVLRLRELTAYIAYLSGDADRALRLSLDLARIHRRSGDAEAAYGNVQSAATAWRAVRDPARGLDLGRDLVGLWSELAAEEGPAAEDADQLESARARMGRLTERARSQTA